MARSVHNDNTGNLVCNLSYLKLTTLDVYFIDNTSAHHIYFVVSDSNFYNRTRTSISLMTPVSASLIELTRNIIKSSDVKSNNSTDSKPTKIFKR